MDETAIAFELPHVRAAATSDPGGGPGPLDRISVRDYTRSLEIGAFATERGVTQRLRFNVVLEVGHHAAAQDDDVDKVISYDTITEAIEAQLAAERVNLLETLAERIAAACLTDARAVRVFVRVEKLDRIPGALGVEIVRSRAEGVARLRPVVPVEGAAALRPLVVHLPNAVLAGPEGADWLAALARHGRAVVCLDPLEPQGRAGSEASLRAGLLSIEQNVWRVMDRAEGFVVCAARTELDWALKTGRPAFWAPAKLVVDAPERPAADAGVPLALAGWLAGELGAEALVAVGAEAVPEAPVPVRRLAAGAAAGLDG
jgi:7,8-dihydroneopterin aldolase/epimerase/oxygenase